MERTPPYRSDGSNGPFDTPRIDLANPLAEEDDFSHPRVEDDSPAVTLFLNWFPAISQLPDIPILNRTRAYRVIEENVDVISIAVIVSSIGLTAIAGIGVFFMSAGIVKLLFFSIQCGSGFIAIISTGGYAKKYFRLRRIQREIKVLNLYKEGAERLIIALGGKNEEFQATIVDLQGQVRSFTENNVLFTAENANLKANLETAEHLCATLREHNEQKDKEHQVLLGQQESLIGTLQTTLEATNQNLKGITGEREQLEVTNASLSKNVEDLNDAVKASQDEFNKFKNANYDICLLFTKLQKHRDEFEKEKQERIKCQKEDRELKEQLKSEVGKLETLNQSISYSTGELTKTQEKLAQIEVELSKRNAELEENNQQLTKITNRLEKAVKRVVAPSSVNNQKE